MIKLPKTKKDPKETEGHCKCRPVCKSRRREWKGQIQESSAELLLDRKPIPDCVRRCPTKLYPNSPCPLFAKTKRLTVVERDAGRNPRVVRVCQGPLDVEVDTPYLRYADMAKKLGALSMVRGGRCMFCACGACCGCAPPSPSLALGYEPRDAERAASRRAHMREFDRRVRTDSLLMRTMYDK